MSAPPIAAVVVKPLMKLNTAFAPRNPAATRGTEGAMDMNAPMDKMFAPKREPLIKCLPGRVRGLEDMRPASFKKATIDPVNVMPPVDGGQCTPPNEMVRYSPMRTPR